MARWHLSCVPTPARAPIPEMTWPLKVPSGFHGPEITQRWWCRGGSPWPPSPAPCSWFKSVGAPPLACSDRTPRRPLLWGAP